MKRLLLLSLFLLLPFQSYAALVTGTNCGFVSSAPSADPTAGDTGIADSISLGAKHTSPADIDSVTEIGAWVDNSDYPGDSDVQVGIYTHDAGDDAPNTLVGSKGTDAFSSGSGWKSISINESLSASTTYWICYQHDNVYPNWDIDRENATGERYVYDVSETNLDDPWGSISGSAEKDIAVYAVYTTGGAEERRSFTFSKVYNPAFGVNVIGQ